MAASEEEEHPAVAALRRRFGLTESLPHLNEALTHPSCRNEHADTASDNQRLEFLGDAVLGLCVSEMLMSAFADVDEGPLTMMRASLVNTEALAEAAREIELGAAIRMGRGAEAAGARERASVLADAVEAFLGAVFLDVGLARAREITGGLLSTRLANLVAQGGIQRDPKSRLQELAQAKGVPTPRYHVVAEDGPPHRRQFTVETTVQNWTDHEASSQEFRGLGEGASKKLAEQAAARKVLEQLAPLSAQDPDA